MGIKGVEKAYSLLTDDVITAAAEDKFHTKCQVVYFTIDDFTEKGDHHASFVTSVQAQVITKDLKREKANFVVKLNPCKKDTIMSTMQDMLFEREGLFLRDVAPQLNLLLKELHQPPLRIPNCYYMSLKSESEIIVLDDKRDYGFRMTERVTGIDAAHATLVLQELASQHAASVILHKRNPEKSMKEKHLYMEDRLLNEDYPTHDFLVKSIEHFMCSGIGFLESVGGQDKLLQWMAEFKSRAFEVYTQQLRKTKNKFEVICHGDCWNNNFLFRYDMEGYPLEIMMVDLQLCRVASLATDLNYFFFSSLAEGVLQKNLDSFLEIYFNKFSEIFQLAGMEMPFSLLELHVEFQNKNMYGLLTGLMLIPIVVSEKEEIEGIDSIKIDNIEENIDKMSENRLTLFMKNKFIKPRMWTIFEVMMENGSIQFE